MTNNQRGSASLVQTLWVIAGILVIVAVGRHLVNQRNSAVTFTTPYQAVFLTNGSVYFGHLQGQGGRSPMLTDVYYIVTQTNSETKQVNNIFLKRSRESYEPDRMYLNPRQILFVEPVGPNSKVAQLIAQQGQSSQGQQNQGQQQQQQPAH